MSTHDDHDLTPEQRRVREALHGLTRPQADPAFRSRLRHEFVSGRIGARRGLTFARPWFLRAFVLVPAAVCALAVVLFAGNRGPDWRVQAVSGEGQVLVNGTAFAASDRAGIGAALKRGGRVQVEGPITVDLVAPGVAAVALSPAAEVVLSAAPNRWWSRGMRASVSAGNAYFSTGRAFHGAHLDVSTPHAQVRAVGTSFAVLCAPFGTCVCVMEGHVRVGRLGSAPGDGVDVPSGMRRIVHPGVPAETDAMLDDSAHELHRQLAEVGEALNR
ncbi:MAG: FecR domain-containing protein [Candidatus Eisenbacteria bacterium]